MGSELGATQSAKISSTFTPSLTQTAKGAYSELSITHASLSMSELSYCSVLLHDVNQNLVASENSSMSGSTVTVTNCISNLGYLSAKFNLSMDSCPLNPNSQDSYTVSCFNSGGVKLIESEVVLVNSVYTTSSIPSFDITPVFDSLLTGVDS